MIKKTGIIITGIFLILVIIIINIHADSPGPNEQYSEDGKAKMDIIMERPVVTESTGDTAELVYTPKKISDGVWQIEYCYKDYKNANTSKFVDIPISKLKEDGKEIQKGQLGGLGELVVPEKITADKECGTFQMEGNAGDSIKIGSESTIIEIVNSSVTFIVTPEYEECNYLKCTSRIILQNNDDYNLTINSSDLSIEIDAIESSIKFYTEYWANVSYENGTHEKLMQRLADNSEGLQINIEPNQSEIFYISATFAIPNTQFKYNVSLFYQDEEYLMDPYFTTNSTNFNGTYFQTFLNASGYIQLNDTYTSGNYTSQIYDSGNISTIWNNISWEGFYKQELPNNQEEETGIGGLNMSGNVLLLHLNNDAEYGEDEDKVYDFSGNENNGTVQGGAVPTSSGKFNGGYVIPDETNYINISDSSSLDVSDEITIEVWVKLNDRELTDGFVSKDNAYRLQISGGGNEKIRFSVYNGGWRNTVSDNILTNGEWYYIVGTANMPNEDAYIYVNGIEIKFNDAWTGTANITNSSDPVNIGCNENLNSCINGIIDEVAVYNRVLSAQEIRDRYTRGVARLNITVRSCDDASCSGDSWNETYIESPQTLSVPDNQYFQYLAEFATENENFTSSLYSTTIGYILNASSTPSPISVIINEPINQWYSYINITLNATITNADDCWYSLDNWTTNITFDCDNTTIINASQGSNILRVGANNTNGSSNTSESISFNVDSITPILVIHSPTNITYNTTTIFLNYSYTETNPNTCWYTLNDSNSTILTNCSTTNITGLSNGSYILEVNINDSAGNSASDNVTFTINETESENEESQSGTGGGIGPAETYESEEEAELSGVEYYLYAFGLTIDPDHPNPIQLATMILLIGGLAIWMIYEESQKEKEEKKNAAYQ